MIKPFAHQIISLKHNDKNPIVFDTSDPGTGKTYVRIMAFAKRRAKGGGCLVVLAPRSLLRSVWLADIKKFAPHLTVAIANASNRKAAFNEVVDVYVTNLDAAKWLAAQKPVFFKRFGKDPELDIDESTAYKHHTSQRSMAVAKIRRYFTFVCLMTGTPNSNSITDVWHQAMILDGGQRLGNSFYKFRESVCTPQQVGRSAHAIKWHDRDGAEEAVFGLLSDIVIRHRFDDCVDIPPNHQYTMDYEMTPKQLTAYRTLEDTQMLWLGKQKAALLAINAAAVRTKLLQIASGAVYDGTGGYVMIDAGRYEMVLDLVEQRKHSLVMFLWKHQRDLMIAEAEKRGVRYCVIDGGTSDRDRNELVQGYQAGVYQVMFGHPASIAHGLTLTRGTATIWPSPTDNLEWFVQGSKRQHRISQTQKTETVVIIAKGTFDEDAWANLSGKDARMKNLLSLFDMTAGHMRKQKKILDAA